MLQSIRDRLTGPVVWFVLGLITVPFAFWGIQSFKSGGGDPTVAQVGGIAGFGGTKITQSQFKQRYEQRYQQLRQLLGEHFPTTFDTARFRTSVLDDLVQETALKQFGKDEGYRAGDDALRSFLETIPAFQKDGKFSADAYHEMLSRQRGLTPTAYEAQVRQALVIDQVKNAVEETAFATPADAWESYRLAGQTRRIAVAQFAVAGFRDKVTVTDDQIKARYEQDKSKFRTAERIKLAYVELDRTKLKPSEAPSADELKKIYDAEKDVRFSTPEERHARHIQITFGTDKAAAKKKAEDLLAAIKGGKDFAEEAKTSSEDPGSKANGGDLGWLRKGSLPVKEIEDAVFGMKAGDIEGPVETTYGYHLVKLDEVRAATTKPFEQADVQTELADVWRTREAEKKFQDLSDKLETVAFEKTEIADVAKELGLEVQTTGWIGHEAGGEGLAAVEAVKQAAFSPEVVAEGQNSKPLPVDSDRLVVVHKAEYEPARDRPLDEVKEQVKDAVVATAAAELAKKEAEALAADIKGGKTIASAAPAHGATLKFDGEAKRNQSDVDLVVVNEAFKMPRPAGGTPEVKAVALADGDQAVIVLTSVSDPEKPAATDDNLKATGSQLRDALGGSEFGAYRKSIENAVNVKIVRPPTADDTGEAQTPEG